MRATIHTMNEFERFNKTPIEKDETLKDENIPESPVEKLYKTLQEMPEDEAEVFSKAGELEFEVVSVVAEGLDKDEEWKQTRLVPLVLEITDVVEKLKALSSVHQNDAYGEIMKEQLPILTKFLDDHQLPVEVQHH